MIFPCHHLIKSEYIFKKGRVERLNLYYADFYSILFSYIRVLSSPKHFTTPNRFLFHLWILSCYSFKLTDFSAKKSDIVHWPRFLTAHRSNNIFCCTMLCNLIICKTYSYPLCYNLKIEQINNTVLVDASISLQQVRNSTSLQTTNSIRLILMQNGLKRCPWFSYSFFHVEPPIQQLDEVIWQSSCVLG